jgi:hypothetical protein
MRIIKPILCTAILLGALLHQSDGQQARPIEEQLRLAGVMPRGAMVYLQARDLSALMKRWMSSPVRDQYYKSSSFSAFSKSRIYIKLQDRKSDFQTALGFGLDEERLSELAGGASAISIYDIGKLEIVLVTEVSRARAIATTMFKQIPQFQERSAGGAPYYVHEVTTDGGRLNQQFCFAYAGGKLIITTTEGLMIRGLANLASPGADSLMSDVMATSAQAEGFATHDLTLWLDQSRLNQNRYFTNYWIHHNAAEQQPNSLAAIQSGLIDLTFAPEGMTERRWFLLKSEDKSKPAGSSMAPEEAAGLLRFAPEGAQLVQIHGPGAGNEALGGVISRALFGRLPDDSASNPPQSSDNNGPGSTTDEGHGRTERYSSLDMRFDVDVDDEQAPRLGAQGGSPAAPGPRKQREPSIDPEKRFARAAAPVLAGLSPVAYSEMTRSSLEPGKPFARFERAVVIEMKSPSTVDRGVLEGAVTSELRARFVVAGAEPKLEWQDDSGIRFVAQTLLEQGAAYSISGKYLVLASTREFARDILQAGTAPNGRNGVKLDSPVEMYALIRVAAAKPVFDKLMSKLDGRTEEATKPAKKNGDDSDSDNETSRDESTDSSDSNSGPTVKFFSDNLSSLIAASAIREMRLQRQTRGQVMIERVSYSW